MIRSLLFLLLTFLALPAAAQQVYRFGGDVYMGGDDVTVSGDKVDDAFLIGNSVLISSPVDGNAHAGGRSVSIAAPVGQNLYAASISVSLSADVGGDAQLAGDTVLVAGAVGGDLRVAAQRVEMTAPIGESALVAAESVYLSDVISGDASISAKKITFTDNARIDGTLYIYSDNAEDILVPESVAPANRIERHPADSFDRSADPDGGATVDRSTSVWIDWLKGVVVGVLTLAVLATLVAAVAPGFLMALRHRTLETPVRAVWIGFLSLSALAGSLFLFALTGYGILLAPASVVLALLLGVAGYVIGTYILGVGILSGLNRPLPETLGERAVAGLVGAVVITLLAMIPIIGWIAALIVAIAGAGALIIRWFAPGFYTEMR